MEKDPWSNGLFSIKVASLRTASEGMVHFLLPLLEPQERHTHEIMSLCSFVFFVLIEAV